MEHCPNCRGSDVYRCTCYAIFCGPCYTRHQEQCHAYQQAHYQSYVAKATERQTTILSFQAWKQTLHFK